MEKTTLSQREGDDCPRRQQFRSTLSQRETAARMCIPYSLVVSGETSALRKIRKALMNDDYIAEMFGLDTDAVQ